MQDFEKFKREAARRALELVQPGMKLGLGTGSTARHFVDLLGERVRDGLSIIAVPTSEATRAQARALDVPLATLDEYPELDLTIDGADEVDSALRLIKGGGGALLREKIVAAASKRMVVIADASKYVARLGAFPLPVEVVPFGLGATRRHIERISAGLDCRGPIALRRTGADGPVFVTDGGHHILDCAFGALADPEALANALQGVPGIVDHGLFIGLASAAILAGADGLKILGDLA
ncbi:ribose-5-phosphate isomerase RpiA [Methylocapsa sp. S129]|uniref:ribose-5-phosphate isomerase RpiA n=1 Tax=Methylocapsa sp. S129 TaxID=1641869 RepID=UPI00131BE0F1|nr:ribose-5-phosphate isomerase RpiA [Methylocapsa sp. S129]